MVLPSFGPSSDKHLRSLGDQSLSRADKVGAQWPMHPVPTRLQVISLPMTLLFFSKRYQIPPFSRSTIYEASVSSAPFRECDHTNLGTSSLCDIGTASGKFDPKMENLNNPSIYMSKVQDEYKKQTGGVPPFLAGNGRGLKSDIRSDP